MEMRRRHQEFLVAQEDPPTRIIVIRAGYQVAGANFLKSNVTETVTKTASIRCERNLLT